MIEVTKDDIDCDEMTACDWCGEAFRQDELNELNHCEECSHVADGYE